MPSRPLPASWLCALAALAFALLVAARPARAQEPAPAAALDPALAAQIRTLATPAAPGLRVDVELGALDARLRLAPCARIEPYVPAGARLWGRSRIGVRCVDGPVRWNVSIPVTVRVHGQALVAAAPLAAGTALSAGDFTLAEVDLAEQPGAPVTDALPLAGRTLARPLRVGEALRATHLRARQWFAAGDTVQVGAAGDGFRIGGTAVALTPGIEGQSARVRTESGRILTGQPNGEGRIEVAL